MDYTLFRRELIYKKRTSLEEFADEHEEITFLIDNMLDSYYFSSADGKDRALRCFNTAYYLCTLILLCENRPEWYFARYCDIAFCGSKGNKVYQSFTLSLVYIFLTHTFYEVPCKKLLNKFETFFIKFGNALIWNDPFMNDYTYKDVCNDLLKDAPDDFLIGEEFSPRKIDKDIFREIDGPGNVWSNLTNDYDGKEVRKIVDSLGKDEEEKHILIELISRDAQRYYGGNNYYHETVKPMLAEIDELIYHKYNDADNQVMMEVKIEELQYQGDIRPLQTRIKELEKEVADLKEQLNKRENATESDGQDQKLIDAQRTIEEQVQTINEQQAELERLSTLNDALTKQNARYGEENPEMDIDEDTALSIKESIIFFSSIMDCSLNKEDISQTNFARLISKITQWPKESIRPKIVEINTERENNTKNNTAFSDGVHQAAVNVCALIENAMAGLKKNPLPFSCKQAVENILKTYKSPGRKIEPYEIAEAKKNLKKT